MTDELELDDAEMDALLAEWDELDQVGAEYLAERVPDVGAELPLEDERWLAQVAASMFPSEAPDDGEIEGIAALMALEHVDWLGLALGAWRRGGGSGLDAQLVQDDMIALEDVEGDLEDPDGHLQVTEAALLHVAPRWHELGVLDDQDQVTERGAWGLPRALFRAWNGSDRAAS